MANIKAGGQIALRFPKQDDLAALAPPKASASPEDVGAARASRPRECQTLRSSSSMGCARIWSTKHVRRASQIADTVSAQLEDHVPTASSELTIASCAAAPPLLPRMSREARLRAEAQKPSGVPRWVEAQLPPPIGFVTELPVLLNRSPILSLRKMIATIRRTAMPAISSAYSTNV